MAQLETFKSSLLPVKCCLHFSVKLRWLHWQLWSSSFNSPTLGGFWILYIFFLVCYTQSYFSDNWRGFIDQLSLHISICHGKGGALWLKDSISELKGEKKRKDEHLSWDTGCSDVYSGVQEKRWQTYWKYVKWHSIIGHWGALPREHIGLKSAQGPSQCKPLERCPFGV